MEKKKNPYELIWYKQGWSDKKVAKNNAKYWEWEIKYNNFVPPNTKKMQLKKINQDHYVVVTDEPIKEGDKFIHPDNLIERASRDLDGRGISKIIASTNKLNGVIHLDLSYIKSLVGEVDVENIVDTKIKNLNTENLSEQEIRVIKSAIKSGYNQCLEDNKDRDKTTEILNHLCDKMELISQEMIDKDQFQLGRYRTFKYMFDYIKSLTQPKDTWDVEFIDGQLKLK